MNAKHDLFAELFTNRATLFSLDHLAVCMRFQDIFFSIAAITCAWYLRKPLILNFLPKKLIKRHYPQRKQQGMKICGSSCTACPYIKQGKGIKINGIDWKFNKQVNCSSYNVVYVICCKKDQCKEVTLTKQKECSSSDLMTIVAMLTMVLT